MLGNMLSHSLETSWARLLRVAEESIEEGRLNLVAYASFSFLVDLLCFYI